jgi:hypothetical protein
MHLMVPEGSTFAKASVFVKTSPGRVAGQVAPSTAASPSPATAWKKPARPSGYDDVSSIRHHRNLLNLLISLKLLIIFLF